MNEKNTVLLEGRIGTKPEMKGEEGKRRTRLNLGINYYRKNDQGEFIQGETDWFPVTCFDNKGKLATRAATLEAGDLVQVRGRLDTSKYNKDGVDIKSINIIADSVKKISLLLDKKSAEVSNHLDAARNAALMED